MTEINQNRVLMSGYPVRFKQQPEQVLKPVQAKAPQQTLRDEFVRQHRKNGLFERLYNGLKNITKLGTGSQKAEAAVARAEAGEITEEEARNVIAQYRKSQVNSAQAFGDLFSVGAAGLTFFNLNKWFRYANAGVKVNQPIVNLVREWVHEEGEKLVSDVSATPQQRKLRSMILKNGKRLYHTVISNKKLAIVATVVSGVFAGGLAKKWMMKIDRIGSHEFKPDKKDYNGLQTREDKSRYKQAKKAGRKERRRANRRNYLSGTINGLMMPIGLLGGYIAAPVMVVGNSLNRYFIGNREEKGNKSVKGYFDNLKSDGLLHAALAAAIAVPMFKKGQWTKEFNKNIAKSIEGLNSSVPKLPEYSQVTAFAQLEKALCDSPEIESILKRDISTEDMIKALSDENIFALKFIQIGNGDIGHGNSNLVKTLKEHCPETRSLADAQAYVEAQLKGCDYKLEKLLGVGTIAETYLANSPSKGKCVVKILKNGINTAKIEGDKEKFLKVIENLDGVSESQKTYLKNNIEDLAKSMSKEVNLKHEMENAAKLAEKTKKANVVRGIEANENVFVMEQAKGISLAQFLEINRLYIELERAQKYKDTRMTESIKEQIARLKERMPDIENVKFNKSDANYLQQKYQELFTEQFHKIYKDGKFVHGDLHDANIMIDLDALRSRKGHVFTIIDMGNIVEIDIPQSLRLLNLTKYIEQGNAREIAEYVLDGANLKVSGLSKEQAVEKVTEELKDYFFSKDIVLKGHMDETKVLETTDGILQKYGIIPSSSMLTLTKSRVSADNSIAALANNIDALNGNIVMNQSSNIGKSVKSGELMLEGVTKSKFYELMVKKQEKENLKQLSNEAKKKLKNNPYAPKTCSEDYITYKLKQARIPEEAVKNNFS